MSSSSLQLPFGETQFEINIPDDNLIGVYRTQGFDTQSNQDEGQMIRSALENPIGTPRLRDLVRPGNTVAIITSDITRPCPSDRLLPLVLEELQSAGVPDGDILIVLGLGLHRPMSENEIDQAITSELHRRFEVLNHDIKDTVRLGVTSRGTPVEIFRPVVEADVRICLGSLDFHWFAGFTGGAKAIFPGCASRATVIANHAMLVQPEAAGGVIEGNPLREDIEEGVAMLGVDFILNVLMDSQHNIVAAVAGDMIEAHRTGCKLVGERGKVKLSQKSDIVLASAGGYPKDINLFQAHKGMEIARRFVREGGILIMVAECRDGIGNDTFERWMLESKSPQDILARFRDQFVLGGHKAAALAAIEEKAQVYMVSGLPDETVHRMYMQPFNSPQSALDHALKEMKANAKVIVLPNAVSILPEIEKS